jgi:flagellar hook-associated protein 3 FlgL
MATGQRLFDPNDDVAATGRVMSYSSEKRSLQQFEQNAQRATTDISVSTTTLNSIKDIANQIFNIAPAAASSGEPSQHAAFASQINGLIEQAFSLVNSQVNGNYLFGGQITGSVPFAATRNGSGQITAVTYNGSNTPANKVAVSENTQVPTMNDGASNVQLGAFLNNLVALRDAVAVPTANNPAVTTTQNTLGDDEDRITTMLVNLSNSQFRIDINRKQNEVRFNQLSNLSSGETDADMASTIVQYQSSQKAYQAALQAGSKMFSRTLLDYI